MLQIHTHTHTICQGLPFHRTIVQREFIHIAYALLFSRRSDCDKNIYQRMLNLLLFFFLNLLSKIFYVKIYFTLNNSKSNSQVNNLDDMKREQFFY